MKSILYLYLTIYCLIDGASFSQAQIISKTFQPKIEAAGTINIIKKQTNGKILIGGNFFKWQDKIVKNIIRINIDGSLDTNFVKNIGEGPASEIFAMDVDPINGNIMVGGNFLSFNGDLLSYFACLDSTGKLNAVFNSKIQTGVDLQVTSITIQSNHKILIGGKFNNFNGKKVKKLIRLFSDGAPDDVFNQKVNNGATPFENDQINAIKCYGNNIIVGGTFRNFILDNNNYIAHLDTNGTIDQKFYNNTKGKITDQVNEISVSSNNKIYVIGDFGDFGGNKNYQGFIRLNSDGKLDTNFKIVVNGNVYSILPDVTDSTLVIGGNFTKINNVVINNTAFIKEDGTFEPISSFNLGKNANLPVLSLCFYLPNKIIAGGNFAFFNDTRKSLSAFNLDGSPNNDNNLDNTFLTRRMNIHQLIRQKNEKILIAGEQGFVNNHQVSSVFRIDATTGLLDESFSNNIGSGPNSSSSTIGLQSDGKIILAGGFSKFQDFAVPHLVRLDTNGVLDKEFLKNTGNNCNGGINKIIVQPITDQIFVVGSFTTFNSKTYKRILKLSKDGNIDNNYVNVGEGANEQIYGAALGNLGGLIIVGEFIKFNDTDVRKIAHITASGVVNPIFQAVGTDIAILGAYVQQNGKIIIKGGFDTFNGINKPRLVRINGSGGVDDTFKFTLKTGGNEFVNNVAFQTIGGEERILITGSFDNLNGNRKYLVRLDEDGGIDNFFDLQEIILNNFTTVFAPLDTLLFISGDFPGSLIRLQIPNIPSNAISDFKADSIVGLQVRLKWNCKKCDKELNNKESFFFQIQRSLTPSFGFETIGTTIDITQYIDKNIMPNTQYFYRVRAVNHGNASNFSNVIGVVISDLITGLNESKLADKIKLYPNPTQGKIYLDVSEIFNIFNNKYQLAIYNQQGQLIQQIPEKNSSIIEIDWSNLTNGLYFLKIYNQNIQLMKKLIKN